MRSTRVTHPGGRPLVSVIIPTRNRADVLPMALDSVYAQEGAEREFAIEVIVVDDASTDATEQVVQRYPGARYFRLPSQRGVSAARNVGIRASRGAYVAFTDDDDLWFPRKLRHQVAALEAQREAAVVYSPYVLRHPDQSETVSQEKNAPSGAIFRAILLEDLCGSPVAVLARRDTFETAGYFDENLPTAEDYDMWLRLAFYFRFAFVPDPVALHRYSLTGKYARHLLQGSPECCARYLVEKSVVEKALAMLPDAAAHADVQQEALCRLEMRTATALCAIGQCERTRAHLLAALTRCPQVLRSESGRSTLVALSRRLVMAADAPIAAATALGTAFQASVGTGGRSPLTQVLVRVWLGVGAALASDHRYAAAGRAVVAATTLSPVFMLGVAIRAGPTIGHEFVRRLQTAASRRLKGLPLAR